MLNLFGVEEVGQRGVAFVTIPAQAEPVMDIGTAGEQPLHHLDMALRGRHDERGVVVVAIGVVDPRTGIEQQLDQLDAVLEARQLEGGLVTVGGARVGVSAGHEQAGDRRGIGLANRVEELGSGLG